MRVQRREERDDWYFHYSSRGLTIRVQGGGVERQAAVMRRLRTKYSDFGATVQVSAWFLASLSSYPIAPPDLRSNSCISNQIPASCSCSMQPRVPVMLGSAFVLLPSLPYLRTYCISAGDWLQHGPDSSGSPEQKSTQGSAHTPSLRGLQLAVAPIRVQDTRLQDPRSLPEQQVQRGQSGTADRLVEWPFQGGGAAHMRGLCGAPTQGQVARRRCRYHQLNDHIRRPGVPTTYGAPCAATGFNLARG